VPANSISIMFYVDENHDYLVAQRLLILVLISLAKMVLAAVLVMLVILLRRQL